MRETHDNVCDREGVFDKAIEMIREAKRLGYHVMTNTTVFKETDVDEVKELCDLTESLGVDGMLISPGYQYESVERDMFLTRQDIHDEVPGDPGVLPASTSSVSTPMFLEFAAGCRDYRCSPWSTVTFTPRGWKGPCYLIGEKFTFSTGTSSGTTPTGSYWESRQDDRCQNCAMHSGFEASVVREAGRNPRTWRAWSPGTCSARRSPSSSMKTFVTGATGFVGWHLARVLVERGDRVRCLVRPGSVVAGLDELAVEIVTGDLRDLDSLRAGIDGVDVVYHCAADYRLYVPDPAAMYACNVDGTSNILQAAATAASSGWSTPAPSAHWVCTPTARPADETTPVRSRTWSATTSAASSWPSASPRSGPARGLPVVIVNPSTPVGERDVKPTATGQMIVDFLRGRMPAYVDTGLNLVDVRDVALGHLLAAERGRVGEKYILGHRNMTLKRSWTNWPGSRGSRPRASGCRTGCRWPSAAVDTGLARLTRRRPRIAVDAVRLSRYRMFFDGSKAVRELGLPQTPVEEPLRRAVEWYRQNGFARRAVA